MDKFGAAGPGTDDGRATAPGLCHLTRMAANPFRTAAT